MTAYCLEFGESKLIIHKLKCGSYDLASLMGEGRISGIGNFASSQLALNTTRERHPDAIRCLDCCKGDLVSLVKAAPQNSSRLPY